MEHKIGAIPFDIKNDRIALLFVTSRGRGRWIFPKGKRKKGESHKQVCKREAFEEAGVKGFVIEDAPLTNLITKSTKDGFMFGFTENYVRVKAPYKHEWVNQLKNCQLNTIDEDGVFIFEAA